MKKLRIFCLTAILYTSNVHLSLAQMVQNVSMPITSSSQEAISTFNQGLALYDLGDVTKAKGYFEKAVEQDPKLCIGYLYLASTSFSPKGYMDNLNKAKAHLNTASEWEKLYYTLMESYSRADMEQRMKVTQQMAEKFPNSARAHHELANAYDDASNIEKARALYKKAISLAPDWVVGYNSLAYSYLFRLPKDFSLAEQNANKLIELSPNHRSAYILLGNAYKAQNKIDEAGTAFTKAIQLDPTMPDAYYDRAGTYNLQGNFESARQDYQMAAKYDEMPSTPIEKTAISYLYENEPQKALQLLMTEAVHVQVPNDAGKTNTARFNLLSSASEIAFYLNDVKSMREIVQKLAPVSAQYFTELGTEEGMQFQKSYMLYFETMIQIMDGDYEGAAANSEVVKKSMEQIKDPRFVKTYHILAGHVSYRKKDFEKAINHFKQTDMQSVYDRYWLARAYEGGGIKDQAMQIYKDIADYNFDDIGYALIRKEVKEKVGP